MVIETIQSTILRLLDLFIHGHLTSFLLIISNFLYVYIGLQWQKLYFTNKESTRGWIDKAFSFQEKYLESLNKIEKLELEIQSLKSKKD